MVQSIEDYSLLNISNRINLRRSQASILYIRFSFFHVFPGKGCLSLSARWKKIMFPGKKIPSFQIIKKDHVPAWSFLERASFQKVWRKYNVSIFHFPSYKKGHVPAQFFWKDHLFRASGKRKYDLPCSALYILRCRVTYLINIRILVIFFCILKKSSCSILNWGAITESCP